MSAQFKHGAPFPVIPGVALSDPWDSMIHRDEVSNLKWHQRSGPRWPNKMLDQDDSFQFLYHLTPKVEHARSAMSIGKLDITWRTALGDRGRLQTSQLQRQVKPRKRKYVWRVPIID